MQVRWSNVSDHLAIRMNLNTTYLSFTKSIQIFTKIMQLDQRKTRAEYNSNIVVAKTSKRVKISTNSKCYLQIGLSYCYSNYFDYYC